MKHVVITGVSSGIGRAAAEDLLKHNYDVLRRELMLYGIEVSVIEPSAVKTAIWDKADQEEISSYQHTDYIQPLKNFQQKFITRGRAGASPEKVTQVIREALESKHPRTRYALPDSLIKGWLLLRLLPDRILDRQLASQFRLLRK